MRIALLRDLPEENWLSIKVYTDQLAQNLRVLNTDIEIVETHVQAWAWPDWRVPMPYGRPASLRTLGLYLSRWVRYPLALRRLKADIYHILDNTYGHLAFFLNPQRLVVTYHSGGSGPPRLIQQWNPKGPAMWIFRLAFRGMLRAAHIIAVSEYAKGEIVEHYDYDPARIHVIYHGVGEHFRVLPQEKRDGVRARFLKPNEEALLLHVGHTAARKNMETLLRAVAALRRQGLAVRLLRVGRSLTPAQETLLDELGIRSWVTQLPPQPNIALVPLYNAADVFVFPSFYEGFGIPLIEAMACGTPVVCSDWELFHEVCGKAALFADPYRPDAFAEAIAQVLTDHSLAATLSKRGLERAMMFTWEQTARKTLAVYHQMMEESG